MSTKVNSPKSCPWGETNIEKTTFSQVMDEQYALQLHSDEEKRLSRLQEELKQTAECVSLGIFFSNSSKKNQTFLQFIFCLIVFQLKFLVFR